MSWTLIVTNVASFITGLVLARWGMRRGLEKATELIDHAHHDQEPTVPKSQRFSVLGVIAVVFGLIIFGLGVRVGFEVLDEQVDCFDTYANELAEAQEVRQDAAERRDAALNDVLRTTRNRLGNDAVPGNQAAIRAALDRYARTYDELEDARRENPYPDAPREVC